MAMMKSLDRLSIGIEESLISH